MVCDRRYTEHSTVGLAQQWDQLNQLGMRIRHNLEQQIQVPFLFKKYFISFHMSLVTGEVFAVDAGKKCFCPAYYILLLVDTGTEDNVEYRYRFI